MNRLLLVILGLVMLCAGCLGGHEIGFREVPFEDPQFEETMVYTHLEIAIAMPEGESVPVSLTLFTGQDDGEGYLSRISTALLGLPDVTMEGNLSNASMVVVGNRTLVVGPDYNLDQSPYEPMKEQQFHGPAAGEVWLQSTEPVVVTIDFFGDEASGNCGTMFSGHLELSSDGSGPVVGHFVIHDEYYCMEHHG